MKNKIKIGILGGDMRQTMLASFFDRDSVECAVWGCEANSPCINDENIVRTIDWKGALNGAKAVILPLPITTDGIRLNCVNNIYTSNVYVPRITEIIESVSGDVIIFGGKIPPTVMRFATEHNVRIIDYYEFEEFQIKNAVPTAEGAIAVAIREMNITLSGSKVAIIGYGRIGRTLALRLKALGANVTCIARSKKDLAWAECDGCVTIKLSKYLENPMPFDMFFNTVPHVIFDSSTISKMPCDQVFIDLASLGGGIDFEAAERHGIKTVKALSLPGKCSPVTAAKIIYDSVKEVLTEEKIL